MRRTETPKPIWIKFCTVVDISDVVTYTNFGDHRLRGFWVSGGQISPSLIDFHRRPYNTLALPCERVMWVPVAVWQVRLRTAISVYFQTQSKKAASVPVSAISWMSEARYAAGVCEASGVFGSSRELKLFLGWLRTAVCGTTVLHRFQVVTCADVDRMIRMSWDVE